MVEGLVRAHGKGPCTRFTYLTHTVSRSDADHSLEAVNNDNRMYPVRRYFMERARSTLQSDWRLCIKWSTQYTSRDRDRHRQGLGVVHGKVLDSQSV